MSLSLVLGIATYKTPEEGSKWEKEYQECTSSWNDTAWEMRPIYQGFGKRLIDAYQEIYENTTENIIGYVHNDTIVYENGWDLRVLKEFENSEVGLVGFGGAKGWGDPNMYKIPYQLPQLARRQFMSNMKSASIHGAPFSGECNVSVLDGFALFVRRELLSKAGGWPVTTPVDYISYDYWVSAMALRYGYKIRLVGVECEHLGGRSSGSNPNLDIKWEEAHRYIYDEFKDVLPVMVN